MAIDWANVKAVEIPEGEAKEVKVNGVVKWTKPGPAPVGVDYLCFTAKEASTRLRLISGGTTPATDLAEIEISNDGTTWSAYTLSTYINLANVGDKVYFRGNNATFSESQNTYYYFAVRNSQEVELSGNVMTLLDKTGQLLSVPSYAFYQLFSSIKTKTAPTLPATTLASGCYMQMFYGCTLLETAPELPATSIASQAYYRMFDGCTALNSLKISATYWSDRDTTKWLNGVSATGTFYCPTALNIPSRSVNGVPSGWNVVRTD